MSSWADSSPGMQAGKIPEEGKQGMEEHPRSKDERKKVVVVGLGMVGIAFMWAINSRNNMAGR
jgi:hypothetical protein